MTHRNHDRANRAAGYLMADALAGHTDGADLTPEQYRAAIERNPQGWIAPELYGPDGVPLDGPRTTAAEYADAGTASIYIGDVPAWWRDWRNAADHEGALYVEAIRGGRAMRERAARLARIAAVYPEAAAEARRLWQAWVR